MSGPPADTYEIRLDGWVKQEEIRSPEEARDAIEQWLCAVEDHPFDDVKNGNRAHRPTRRARTIHPAPGMTELAQRSAP